MSYRDYLEKLRDEAEPGHAGHDVYSSGDPDRSPTWLECCSSGGHIHEVEIKEPALSRSDWERREHARHVAERLFELLRESGAL
jgi:hypothetical protein